MKTIMDTIASFITGLRRGKFLIIITPIVVAGLWYRAQPDDINDHRITGNITEGMEENTEEAAEETEEEMPLIVDILIGDEYYIALCEDGSVWSWGDNSKGKLGVMDTELAEPREISGLSHIKKLVDDERIVYALTDSGDVYYWGRNRESTFQWGADARHNMQYTPMRIDGLKDIIEIDAQNERMLALDSEGIIYSTGIYLKDHENLSDMTPLFSEEYEMLRTRAGHVVAGAGNYHYFVREDKGVFSIMEYQNQGGGEPYAFIFPRADGQDGGGRAYYFPEELEDIIMLNDDWEYCTVYFDLPGVGNAEQISSDAYTMFLSETDGSLWYWNSDRITYHDNPLPLTSPDDGMEHCGGYFVKIRGEDIRAYNKEDGFRIADMKSSRENTLFLTTEGEVFISWYETVDVKNVKYWRRSNPAPERLPFVNEIQDLHLKELRFCMVDLRDIVSISANAQGCLGAVDVNGNCYSINFENVNQINITEVWTSNLKENMNP